MTAPAADRKIRVVLADDADDIRQLLDLALTSDGRFEIIGEASDGEAAVAVVARERPDVVVLDLAMPVLDGLEAIPVIRCQSPLTRIVVLSGFAAQQMAEEALRLGADAYLEKGTAFHDLAGVLADVHTAAERAAGTATAAIPSDDGRTSGADLSASSGPSRSRLLLAAFNDLADRSEGRAPFDRVSFSVLVAPHTFKIVVTSGGAAWRLPPGATVAVGDEMWQQFTDGHAVAVADTLEGIDQPENAELRRRGLRSYVSIPIQVGGELCAIVSFSRLDPEAFSDNEIAALESVARASGETLALLHLLDIERTANEHLRDLDRLKNDFLGMVAHDLRSPMAVIAGFSEALERGWETLPEAQKREFVGIMGRRVGGLSALVEDLLTVAHIQSGEFHLDLRPLDLAELASQVAADVSGTAGRMVKTVVENSLPEVHGDRRRQQQVLTNLIENAVKFSPDDSPVEVRIARRDGQVEVAVADRGIGIAIEDLPSVFERFFRCAQRTHEKKGTGLGLYICRSLVEAWGGTIRVESVRGEGSTFTYSVPIETASESLATTSTPGPPAVVGSARVGEPVAHVASVAETDAATPVRS